MFVDISLNYIRKNKFASKYDLNDQQLLKSHVREKNSSYNSKAGTSFPKRYLLQSKNSPPAAKKCYYHLIIQSSPCLSMGKIFFSPYSYADSSVSYIWEKIYA